MGLQKFSILAGFFAMALAQVPPPEIKPEWVKAVDLSNVPNISPKLEGTGTCPGTTCSPGDCEKCWESCGNCARDEDIYGCTANKWALTFDDGPSDKTTELLDILGASNVKATFLMLGSNVIKYPAVVKRAYEAGHQIASHTWSHPHLMSLSNEQIIAEVKSTEEAIFNITGVRPAFIRPPYGQADDRVKAVLKSMGYHNLMWNMDTLDWDIVNKKQDPTLILNSFKKALTQGTVINPKKDPGFVSLQHDLYIDTIKKTPQIDELLKQNGFTLVLAHECAGLKSGYQELDNVDAQNHPENSASSTSTLPALGLLLLPLLVTNI